MVNASLNWASIVGIVLAVGGTMLYFLRTFKPGLARDYDVFFAAVGLLCGGILFFQGWRLDPILQFGQFLLAASTVFFAYESVRLRSVTTEQARRSAYFDDDEPAPARPRMGRGEWGNDERFDDPQPLRRRIRSRADDGYGDGAEDDDFYRPRRPERRAIPERAQSRFGEAESTSDQRSGGWNEEPGRERERSAPRDRSRYAASASRSEDRPEFGARRRERDARPSRSGSRPSAPPEDLPRSSRRPAAPEPRPQRPTSSVPQGAPISDAEFSPVGSPSATGSAAATGGAAAPARPASTRPSGSAAGNPDNSSRFDD